MPTRLADVRSARSVLVRAPPETSPVCYRRLLRHQAGQGVDDVSDLASWDPGRADPAAGLAVPAAAHVPPRAGRAGHLVAYCRSVAEVARHVDLASLEPAQASGTKPRPPTVYASLLGALWRPWWAAVGAGGQRTGAAAAVTRSVQWAQGVLAGYLRAAQRTTSHRFHRCGNGRGIGPTSNLCSAISPETGAAMMRPSDAGTASVHLTPEDPWHPS